MLCHFNAFWGLKKGFHPISYITNSTCSTHNILTTTFGTKYEKKRWLSTPFHGLQITMVTLLFANISKIVRSLESLFLYHNLWYFIEELIKMLENTLSVLLGFVLNVWNHTTRKNSQTRNVSISVVRPSYRRLQLLMDGQFILIHTRTCYTKGGCIMI